MRRERAPEPATVSCAPVAPWRLFWRMARYRPWLYTVDTLLVIAGTVLFLVPGLIARAVFDTLTGQTPGWSVGLGIYGLVVLLVGTQVARMAINVLTILVDLTVRHSLHGLQRKNLMRRLLELPAASALPVAPGEAINRFRDDAGETALFLAWIGLLNVVGMVAFAAVALVVMLRIDAAITFAVFLPLAVVIAVAEAAGRRVERYRSASREAAGRVSAFLGETFGAVLSIQVAGAEERMVEQLRLRNEQRLRQVLRERLFGEGLRSVFSSTVHLGTGGILLLAGNAMRTGSFTVGDFALFIYVLTWVTALTQSFGALLARYQQTRVSFDRLAVLLQGAPPERLVEPVPIFLHRPAPAAPYTPKLPAHRLETLHAVGLTYRFPSSRRGIVDVNLHVARGTFTVITGPVGAG
ncbi:MAG TPA: ABC transporter ATP-binding protein, partial [Chloroflexota bacterium]|nr:ABC transporter ATP-binding protein [Chloroflexota bacterium]